MNKKLNKKPGQPIAKKYEIRVWKYNKYLLLAVIFILSGLYFYLFGNYIFFYQENLSLFIFSCDYLKQFTSKPGGLLEYIGNFFSQGYFNNLYGALILSLIFTLLTIIFLKINKKLAPESLFFIPFAVVASCFLILMQTNINFLFHNNLGFLLAGLYFLISITSKKKISRILVLVFFPVFFYMTGAYAWIFLGMFALYKVLKKEVVFPVCLILFAGISLLLSKVIIFMQPWSELLYYPLPLKDYFVHPSILWILILFFVFYPALFIIISALKIRNNYSIKIPAFSTLFILLLTVYFLLRLYDRNTADMFNLEKMFFARDWDGVIRHQEIHQSQNLVAQYYYNTALAEKGMLCDRIFFTPQDYGTQSIMIAWNSQISINRLFRGVYFYYSIGLINEVHRWAFESMVIQGYRPENIKLLIKTDLINGHYKVADKHINVLKKTLHYRDLAKKYEAMLINPELMKSDPELGNKIKLKPHDDFIVRIRNPEKNIDLLLESNPNNKRAFEYKMACFMLEKNVEGIVNDMGRLSEMGYSTIPRHIEEAAVLFKAQVGLLPELAGLNISRETETRFSNYISSIKSVDTMKSSGGSGIQKELRNTLWYYLDFKKPMF